MEAPPTSFHIHQKVSLATFSACYRLCKDTPMTSFYFFVETIALFLHEISFPFSMEIQESTLFPMSFFRNIRLFWVDGAGFSLQMASAYCLAALLIGNVAYLIFLVRFYSIRRTSSRPPSFWMQLMSLQLQWTCGPLTVPILSMISYYVLCNEIDSCSLGNINPAEVVFFTVVMVVHTLISAMYMSCIMSWSPLKNKLFTKAHGQVGIVATLFKTVASVITSVQWTLNYPLSTLATLIYCILYQVILAAMYCYQLPFYSIATNQVRISIYTIAAMASLSTLLRLELTDSGDIICMTLFCIGSLLLLPAGYLLVRWRLSHIAEKPATSLKNGTEVDIRARMAMLRIMDIQSEITTSSNIGASNNIQQKKMGIEEMNQLSEDKQRMNNAWLNELNELDALFKIATTNIKSSFCYNLTWATYVYLFKGNRFLAMQRIRYSLEQHPFFFDILPLQVRLRCVAEAKESEDEHSMMATYEEQQRLERMAVQTISKGLLLQIRFWGTLISQDYNLKDMETLSEHISKSIETGKLLFQRLLFLNPRNVSFRRLYSQFLSIVMNDESGSKRQLTRALELENEEDHSRLVTDGSNCIIVLSCEKETFGQILEANDKTSQVFGISSEEILGRKITSLMARPYVDLHNKRILDYIERGLSGSSPWALLAEEGKEVSMKASLQEDVQCIEKAGLWMRSLNGFIFPGDLRVCEYSNFSLEPTMTMLGSIRPRPMKCVCIVSKSEKMITDVSSSFFTMFNPDMAKVKNHELPISQVIPPFHEHLEPLQAHLNGKRHCEPYCFHFDPNQGGERGSLGILVKVFNLNYTEEEYWLVRVESGMDERLEEDHEGLMEFQQEGHGMVDEQKKKGQKQHEKGKTEVGFSRKPKVEIAAPLGGPLSTSKYSDDSAESESSEETEDKEESSEGDKASSRHSGSVSSSKSGSLLRMGLLKASGQLDPRLRVFLYWIYFLPCLLSAMAICLQWVSSTYSDARFTATLDILSTPISMGTLLSLYSTVMFDHIFRNTFVFPNSTFNNSIEDTRIRRELNHFLSSMSQYESNIYSNQGSGLTPGEVAFIKNAAASIVYVDSASDGVTVVDLTKYYQNAIAMMLKQNLTQLRTSLSSPLYFFRGNMNTNITQVWDSIVALVLATQDSYESMVITISLGFMVAALGLGVLVILFIVLPSLANLFQQKAAVFHLFEQMEHGNIRQIYSLCVQKMVEFQGEEDTNNNIEIQDMMEVIQSKSAAEGVFTKEIAASPESGSSPEKSPSGKLQSPAKSKRSSRSQTRLSDVIKSNSFLVFFSVIIITAVYFVGYYLWWSTLSNTQLKGLDQRVRLSRSRNYYTRKIVMEFMAYSDALKQFVINDTLIAQLEDSLFQTDHALYYGDPAYSVDFDLRVYPGGDAMLGGNVCQLFVSNNVYQLHNNTPCETFGGGVLTQGAHAVITDFITLSQGLRRIYRSGDTQNYLLKLIELKSFGDDWIPSMCIMFDNWIHNIALSEFHNALQIRIIGTVLAIIIWLGFTAFLYYPQIYRLNHQLQKSRDMLAIIPPDFIENSKVIREQLRHIALKMIQAK